MKRVAQGHVSPIPKRQKYRSYSPTSLSNAYTDVLEKKISVYKAAKIYSVPEQTLRDRISGKIDFETTRSGPGPIFNNEEEVRLVNHIKEIARVGYAYTRAEVVNIASEYAVCLQSRTREKPLTLKWFYGFLSRWPELKVRRPKTISDLRARATSEESINNYFDELKRIIDKHDLHSRPEAIYNVDEKGIQQNFKPPSVVSDADCIPSIITSERSSTTTVIGCGNALGQAIPPYFVFAGSRMRQELLEGSTHGANGTVSQSGWSNSDIFSTYLKDHFIRYSTPRSAEKPLLLLYDGHRSHINPNLIDWAVENHIILYVLPPHTSHILQPMDVGCFGPFSKIYGNECLKFQRSQGASVTRYNVSLVACKAYAAALSPPNLQSAFRRSGIYPFNPDSIDRSLFIMSKEREQHVQEQTEGGLQEHTVDDQQCIAADANVNQNNRSSTHTSTNVDTSSDANIVSETPKTSHIDKSRQINVEVDNGDASVKFFQKRKPVFVPPFKVQRKSINKIVSGKAITEKEISEKVKIYFQQTNSKSVKKSKSVTKKGKSPQPRSTSKTKKQNNAVGTLSAVTELEPTPGPSGIQKKFLTDDSDSSTENEDEKCCVCKKFQPDALKRAVSLVFTKWGECMFEGCNHWVHLKYCCNVTVLRRHDKFYCPCHGLACKPVNTLEE